VLSSAKSAADLTQQMLAYSGRAALFSKPWIYPHRGEHSAIAGFDGLQEGGGQAQPGEGLARIEADSGRSGR